VAIEQLVAALLQLIRNLNILAKYRDGHSHNARQIAQTRERWELAGLHFVPNVDFFIISCARPGWLGNGPLAHRTNPL
jgi:hypothetical protein